MAAAAAGAAMTHAAPTAIPPRVAAAPMAASPEEILAAPRPGTPSALTTWAAVPYGSTDAGAGLAPSTSSSRFPCRSAMRPTSTPS